MSSPLFAVLALFDRLITLGGNEPRKVARTIFILLFILYITRKIKHQLFAHGFRYAIMQLLFSCYRTYKGQKGMEKQMFEIKEKLVEAIIPEEIHECNNNLYLPLQTISKKDLLQKLHAWSNRECKLWNGSEQFVSGAVYHGGKELTDLQNTVYSLFSVSNPLHADIFPYVRKMESEIIAMTLSLFNGDIHNNDSHCGLITSGGTESLIMAIRCYKQYNIKYNNILKPEIITPITIHAAVDKACELMDIKLIKIPIDTTKGGTFTVNVSDIECQITSNTIAIIGSAPSFGQGIIDPIYEMSLIAEKYNIGLHVDCCLGSFLLPFIKRQKSLSAFDFECKGVTSISCDTHKYGFGNKGTSVLMFNSKKLRKEGYFLYSDSSMGMYATPTMAGSRSGGLIAATWATMVYLGNQGYENAAVNIVKCMDIVKRRIKHEISEIRIMGDPKVSVIALETCIKDLSIFKINDAMHRRKWSLTSCQNPNCIHMAFTIANCNYGDKFVDDLKESIKQVLQEPELFKDTSGAIYGTFVSIPSDTFKNDILSTYLDVIYDCY